jgi:hypothetical protein
MADIRPLVDVSEWLYRRCYSTPLKNYLNPDGTATSRAFKLREKDNRELSVDVKRMTTPEVSIGDSSKFILFEIANQEVMNLDLSTFYDPCYEATHGFDNLSHAVIVGIEMNDEIMAGLLARKAQRVIM